MWLVGSSVVFSASLLGAWLTPWPFATHSTIGSKFLNNNVFKFASDIVCGSNQSALQLKFTYLADIDPNIPE